MSPEQNTSSLISMSLFKRAERDMTDEEIAKEFSEFLKSYAPAPAIADQDILNDRYQIDLSAPLPEYDWPSATAYNVVDTVSPSKAYIALVCKPGSVQRYHMLSPMLAAPHAHILPLVSYGLVRLSRPDEERFVLIYERPRGKKLSVLINNMKARPSFDFICQNIILPIALAVQHMTELGFAHGSINPDNIYFEETAMLGPCVVEPCGISQSFIYEPLDRLLCNDSGKGDGVSPIDYYALAVVVIQIIYGARHFDGIVKEALIQNIIKDGAFAALTRNKDAPEIFYDFFRGLLSLYNHDRWGFRYLKAWLDGKRYNVMPPPPPKESLRPFEFANGLANSRRELAYLFSKNWAQVPEVFVQGQLVNWINISLRNKELSEYLTRLTKSVNASNKKSGTQLDEQIMQMLCVLDTAGPIRIRELSFHLEGINTLFIHLVANGSQPDLQLIMRFIELSMYQFVVDQQKKLFEERIGENTQPRIENTLTKLEKLRGLIRNTGIGFGVERAMYDLNPNMPCLSPMLAGYHVTSLPELLRALDRLAPKLHREHDPMDRHIAAFIASKLGLLHSLNLVDLELQPKLAHNHAFIALKLLGAAQFRSRLNLLPGLSYWLAIRMFPSLEVIRSKTLVRKLKNMLYKSARGGNLPKMAELMISSGYAAAEATAYTQAIQTYRNNAIKIIQYRKGDMLEAHSAELGTRIAHHVSVVGLLFSFIIAVKWW